MTKQTNNSLNINYGENYFLGKSIGIYHTLNNNADDINTTMILIIQLNILESSYNVCSYEFL